jgi:long-subunit fatty acid transport protein
MRASLTLLVILAARPALAQTNDSLFADWRLDQDTGAPRAAGLGGAFVAVADDASAVMLNPAGLVRLGKAEIAASLLSRGAAQGGTLRSRTSVGYVGGAGLLSRRWAVGGFLSVPHDRHTSFPSVSSTSSRGPGFFDTTVTDAGAALSWQPTARLSLGLRLNVTHLRLQADVNTIAADGSDLFIGMAASGNRVTGDAGLLFDASDALRFGLVYRQGATWTVERLARDVSRDVLLDESPYELRSPSALRAGLAYRINEHLLLTGQGDLVFGAPAGSIRITRSAFRSNDYTRETALDGRAGVEVSWNAGSVSLQLRGGIAREAAGAIVYVGADDSESRLFDGQSSSTFGTAGASIVAAPGAGTEFGVHLASAFGGERTVVSGGISLRF